MREEKKKNFDDFVRKYPGLKQEKIEDTAQFNSQPRVSIDKSKEKMKEILRNPDMSFCNFMISLCMCVISFITFYSHRDFNNEYFNRQLIY